MDWRSAETQRPEPGQAVLCLFSNGHIGLGACTLVDGGQWQWARVGMGRNGQYQPLCSDTACSWTYFDWPPELEAHRVALNMPRMNEEEHGRLEGREQG